MKLILVFSTFFVFTSTFSQSIYYQDIFNGGVCVVGIASADATGSFQLPVYIEPISTIKKIFLVVYKQRYENIQEFSYILSLDNIDFEFNQNTFSGNFVENGFSSNPANTSGYEIHVKDITQSFTITNSTINLEINNFDSPINCPACKPSGPVLVVLYENSNLPLINYSMILNSGEENSTNNITINNTNPVNLDFDVALSIQSDRLGGNLNDGYNFNINSNFIGSLNQADIPFNIAGVIGCFYFQNGILFGLTDDTSDNLVGGSDGLMRLNNFIIGPTINGTDLTMDYIPPSNTYLHNILVGYHLTYTTPCDTFSVSVPNDTSVCYGTQLQLNATGGQTYEWLPATGLSCANCPNPIFTADSSMHYTVRIWNNDTCSVVRPVKINVLPLPTFASIEVTPTTCGIVDGQVNLVADSRVIGTPEYTMNNGTPQTLGNFTNLAEVSYTFTITDDFGCISEDTLVNVGVTNPTIASFTLDPTSGLVPLTVHINNTSQNATDFLWSVNGINQGSNLNTQILDTAGTYSFELVAWQHDISCADTALRSVIVLHKVVIPTAFTPDNDLVDDYWEILNLDEQYPKNVVKVFNRWGNLVYESIQGKYAEKPWKGDFKGEALPFGSYYYIIEVNDGKTENLNGTVSVLLK